jgi:hypothetical protein
MATEATQHSLRESVASVGSTRTVGTVRGNGLQQWIVDGGGGSPNPWGIDTRSRLSRMRPDRPDYIPTWWGSDVVTRWMSRSPGRALTVYVAYGLFAAAVIFWRVADGERFLSIFGVAGSAAPFPAAALLGFSWVYGWRARRAMTGLRPSD